MAEEKKDDKPKKSLDPMFLLVLVFSVLNLAAVGIGAFWTYQATLGWHAPVILEQDLAAAAAKDSENLELQEPLIFTLEKFTVNLEGQPARMIRVELNVEMLSPDGFEEVIVSDNQAKVRDAVLKILGGKKLNDIESLQGKLFLKDEIAKAVNKTLDRGVVKDIFFSEFVVQ